MTTKSNDNIKVPGLSSGEKTGWEMFSEEVAWFIYDFCKYDLTGYEMLIFYSYFINGMTLEEIAESADCSFQWVGVVVKRIEEKLRHRWLHKDEWSVENDGTGTNKRHRKKNKKRSK